MQITPSKLADQHDQHGAERRFMATFEQSAVGMAHMHETGRFIRVNRKLCEILGYPCEALLAKTFVEITHPDDLELDLTLARQVIAGEIPHYSIDKRYLRADGSFIWCTLTITPVRTPDDAIDYYSAVIVDISDRKNMENALRESEERFRLALDATHDAIWDYDITRKTVWWSNICREAYGDPPDSVDENWQWWASRISPNDRERIETTLRAALEGGHHHWQAEYQYMRKDGSWADVTDIAFIARDSTGAAVRMLGVIRDITEQKQAVKRMQETDRMALIGNLAAGLSHDMSNIVLPMSLALEVLSHAGVPDRATASLNLLQTCVNSLASLTNSVRRLARGEELSNPQTIDLAQWWEETGSLYRAAMPRGVTLKGSITQSGLLINANPDRLTRAVLNMVVNAAEAITGSSQRGGRVTVWSHQTKNSAHILLGVRDNGPGIPPEIRQRIFEPLFSTKKQGLSTGMGMSVISSFAQDCGGSVEIHSEPGHGANIILRLPSVRTK